MKFEECKVFTDLLNHLEKEIEMKRINPIYISEAINVLQKTEEYEEPKKTLSDKKNQYEFGDNWYYHQDDVKEALKEFIESYKHLTRYEHIKQKAKEIFGGDLVD